MATTIRPFILEALQKALWGKHVLFIVRTEERAEGVLEEIGEFLKNKPTTRSMNTVYVGIGSLRVTAQIHMAWRGGRCDVACLEEDVGTEARKGVEDCAAEVVVETR